MTALDVALLSLPVLTVAAWWSTRDFITLARREGLLHEHAAQFQAAAFVLLCILATAASLLALNFYFRFLPAGVSLLVLVLIVLALTTPPIAWRVLRGRFG